MSYNSFDSGYSTSNFIFSLLGPFRTISANAIVDAISAFMVYKKIAWDTNFSIVWSLVISILFEGKNSMCFLSIINV